ncbi:MAG: flagellar basal body-associated FliL family protein [Gammaproteobacteria bacterium]|nr:flagellar basal body-associated FliL family protein [Gammaproteobacteria bacterium]
MKKFLLTVIVLVTTLLGLSYSGMLPLEYFGMEVSQTEEGHSEAPPPTSSETHYLPIDPPFIVNFTHLGALRYLQISIEIMYPKEDIIDRVIEHMPAIRNSLILLLSDQPYEKLSTFEGKEVLRGEMVAAVNEIVYRGSVVEFPGEMFITNFVMQ